MMQSVCSILALVGVATSASLSQNNVNHQISREEIHEGDVYYFRHCYASPTEELEILMYPEKNEFLFKDIGAAKWSGFWSLDQTKVECPDKDSCFLTNKHTGVHYLCEKEGVEIFTALCDQESSVFAECKVQPATTDKKDKSKPKEDTHVKENQYFRHCYASPTEELEIMMYPNKNEFLFKDVGAGKWSGFWSLDHTTVECPDKESCFLTNKNNGVHFLCEKEGADTISNLCQKETSLFAECKL